MLLLMKIKLSQAIYSVIYDFQNKKTHKAGLQKPQLSAFVIQLAKQSSSSSWMVLKKHSSKADLFYT